MSQETLMHELRTPLQLIACCARLLREEVSDDTARSHAELLLSGVNDLDALLTRGLEENRPELTRDRPTRCDIVACAREAAERFRPMSLQKGIDLMLRSNVRRLDTAMDAYKFRRIALNLLSNAIKFTPAGGKVEVRVTACGDTAQVDFTDSGCGIAPDRLSRIFLTGETDTGYGYGLPVAQKCAEQMGARLTVRSEIGIGSTFTLCLPVRETA